MIYSIHNNNNNKTVFMHLSINLITTSLFSAPLFSETFSIVVQNFYSDPLLKIISMLILNSHIPFLQFEFQ